MIRPNMMQPRRRAMENIFPVLIIILLVVVLAFALRRGGFPG